MSSLAHLELEARRRQPVSSSTRRTSLTSAAWASWRWEMLTATARSLWPASCHLRPWTQAAHSAHWPSGTARPATSASETRVGRLLDAVLAPPAQQRLDAHDRAGLALDDRLPVELELALDESAPQLRLGRLALGRERARARRVHVPESPPFSLARFIATVAPCSSVSVSGPSSGKSAIEARRHQEGRGLRC